MLELPAHLMTKNYVLLAPLATHWRPATCQEVECAAWTTGWELVFPDGPDRAERVAYVRADRVRAKREFLRADGAIVFRFGPETPTYAGDGKHNQHRVRIDRPELFAVREPGAARLTLHRGRENGAVDWVDDFANNQIKVAEIHQRHGKA